ncbi:MAG: hypothetical protein KME16_02555 [Scytolyngbya sp. HA4215-MV1]|nr:hypothetical protein [Scytolyngbya sp. HA4215-MV1]
MRYPKPTMKRAERAIQCSPFGLALFVSIMHQSVSLSEIAGASGVQHRFTKMPVSELAAENALLWLIQVGVLRREVDGQGLTDSFRLTPLGRQLVEKVQQRGMNQFPAPTLSDRLYNAVSRWMRFPF